MSEEKKLILEMLQAGKITAQEAESLLAAVDGPQHTRRPSSQEESARDGENLVEGIVNSIRTGLSSLNLTLDFGDANRITLAESRSGELTGSEIELDLQTRNGSIVIETWSQATYKLDIVKAVRAGTREEAEELAAAYSYLEVGDNLLRAGDFQSRETGNRISVSLRLRLPESQHYFGQVITANGRIELTGLDCHDLKVQSANGSVKVLGVNARSVDAKSINGSMRLEGNMAKVKGKATNGSVTLVNVAEQSTNQMETVNGRVEARIPARNDVAIDAQASTSHGSIKMEHSTLAVVDESRRPGKRYLKAATPWDSGKGSIHLDLRTVNGSIRIFEL